MSNRRTLFLGVVLATVAIMAFLLRDVFRVVVVPAIGKLFFILRGYYGSLEQSSYWPLILGSILVLGLSSLRIVDWDFRINLERKHLRQGEVHQFSFWLERIEHGHSFFDGLSQNPYPRWYVTRTLANLAVDMLNRRGATEARSGQLQGPGWAPPPEIQKVLEIALRSNPATFTTMLESASMKHIPDVESIIQYIESFAENSK